MPHHDLKIWPEYFEAVLDGTKTWELRRRDRDFRVGDTVSLNEFNPASGLFTGRTTLHRITYVLSNVQIGVAGLDRSYCVFSIVPVPLGAPAPGETI